MSFDAPSPWGIYFQDSASPQSEGLIELHEWNTVIILFIIFIDTVNDLLSFLSAPLKEVSLFLYVYISIYIKKNIRLKRLHLHNLSVINYWFNSCMSIATTYNKKSHSNIKYNITNSARYGRKLVNRCSHSSDKLNFNSVFICLNESLLRNSFPTFQTHSFLNNNHMYSLFSTTARYNSKDSTQGDTSPATGGGGSPAQTLRNWAGYKK